MAVKRTTKRVLILLIGLALLLAILGSEARTAHPAALEVAVAIQLAPEGSDEVSAAEPPSLRIDD